LSHFYIYYSNNLHFISKYYEKRNELNKELREKKIPTYVEFIKFYFFLLNAENMGKKAPTQKENVVFLNDFIQKL